MPAYPGDVPRARPSHAEVHHAEGSGEDIRIACTCSLGRDHDFAEWLTRTRNFVSPHHTPVAKPSLYS